MHFGKGALPTYRRQAVHQRLGRAAGKTWQEGVDAMAARRITIRPGQKKTITLPGPVRKIIITQKPR